MHARAHIAARLGVDEKDSNIRIIEKGYYNITVHLCQKMHDYCEFLTS